LAIGFTLIAGEGLGASENHTVSNDSLGKELCEITTSSCVSFAQNEIA